MTCGTSRPFRKRDIYFHSKRAGPSDTPENKRLTKTRRSKPNHLLFAALLRAETARFGGRRTDAYLPLSRKQNTPPGVWPKRGTTEVAVVRNRVSSARVTSVPFWSGASDCGVGRPARAATPIRDEHPVRRASSLVIPTRHEDALRRAGSATRCRRRRLRPGYRRRIPG